MSTVIQSCAGGWCTRRDHCANYHAASPDQTPAERLCPPGRDGAGAEEPVRLHGPAGHLERPAGPMAAMGFWEAMG